VALALLHIIDLRALEFVGVIDVDGLPCGEEVEGAEAFAVALPVCLTPPKGR